MLPPPWVYAASNGTKKSSRGEGCSVKRIITWVLGTVTVVALMFGYRTSTNRTDNEALAESTPPVPISGGDTSAGNSAKASPTVTATPMATMTAVPSKTATPAKTKSPTPMSVTTPTASSKPSGTFTGDAAQTRYGAVQVAITVSNGKITGIDVPHYPDSQQRDAEINRQALPILIHETLSAQSANIDMVSGGTFTSMGYLQSLQSALDKAGL